MKTQALPYAPDRVEFIGEVSGIPCYRFVKNHPYSWDYCFNPPGPDGHWLWSGSRFRGVKGDFRNQHTEGSGLPIETEHAISEFLAAHYKLSL